MVMKQPNPAFPDLRRQARYLAGRLLLGAASRVPRRAGLPLGALLGRVGYAVVARDRRIAEANLRAAFPDWSAAETRRAARKVFEELGRNIYDVAACAHWSPAARRRNLDVAGIENLEQALAAGRGAILFGAHQGAWELVAVALADQGIDVTGVARPVREARLETWLAAHRRRLGIRTIPAGGLESARAMLRALGGGGILGVLLDHRVRKGGVVADFFGRPARFAAGPVRLALRTGARLVPARIARRADGGHRVLIEPALPALPAGLPPRDAAERTLRAAVAALETMIRRDPAAWAWIHPRWGRPAADDGAAREWSARTSGALPALGFALAALLAAAGCGDGSGGSSSGVGSGTASSTLTGITLRETVEGRLRWILRADSSETDERQSQTLIRGLHVDFYDPAGAVSSVLTSDEGVVQRSTNDMTARGNVLLISARGETLATETLDWNNTIGRIRTADPFRLARPDGWLTGVGFESDPDLKSYTTKDVRIDSRNDAGDRR